MSKIMKRSDYAFLKYIPGSPLEEALSIEECEFVREFQKEHYKAPELMLTDVEVKRIEEIVRKVEEYKNDLFNKTYNGRFASQEDKLSFTDLIHELINFVDDPLEEQLEIPDKLKNKNLKTVRVVIDMPVHMAMLMLVIENARTPLHPDYNWQRVVEEIFSDKRGNYTRRLKPLVYNLLRDDMYENLHQLCVTNWLTPEEFAENNIIQ